MRVLLTMRDPEHFGYYISKVIEAKEVTFDRFNETVSVIAENLDNDQIVPVKYKTYVFHTCYDDITRLKYNLRDKGYLDLEGYREVK